MTYKALKERAKRKGAKLERTGKWVRVVDAKSKVVIADLDGENMSERLLLLQLEDKIEWLDVT